MKNFKLIVSVALAFVLVLFTLQNTDVAAIKFLFWEFSMSRVLLFLLIFCIGGIAGYLAGNWQRSHKAKEEDFPENVKKERQ